jgi:hypothetical protein
VQLEAQSIWLTDVERAEIRRDDTSQLVIDPFDHLHGLARLITEPRQEFAVRAN